MKIRCAKTEDAQHIIDIYNWYIVNTIITFETDPVSFAEMQERIGEKLQNHDWLIAEIDNEIIGYAYYGVFRVRVAYRHTVESTIYLSKEYKGRGLGMPLYSALIDSAKNKGFREMLGVIALPNPESIKFHKKSGFNDAGTLKNIGFKFGRYIDVAILQKTIV
ncbi:MAG: N-acetyltransferase [Deltaproteobacteria bacterium]|nr:N-acetyltransferase [Deltaproteobacteria bacterium]